MCSTGPFTYRWLKGYICSSCYCHHQIGSIHLSHCFHIFPWLCAWVVCYIIFCHLLYIHSGKTGNLFSLVLCSLWWAQIVGYVLACRSYSFVCTLHHLIIIIVQTVSDKQRVLMHGHQGWNVRHGLCHIYMIYVYIWVVYSFCLFCCLFIIVTTQFVALYKPCKPKPKFR